MTGREKAAFLLLQLPGEEAGTVLDRLGPDRQEKLRADMDRLQQEPPAPEVVDQLLEELERLLGDSPVVTPQTIAQVESTGQPEGVAPSEPAAAPEEKPDEKVPAGEGEVATTQTPPSSSPPVKPGEPLPDESAIESDPMAALRQMAGGGPTSAAANVDRLALALQDEHSRTVALVLTQMEPDRAGEVLKRLSPEKRRDVSPYLGKELAVSPELVNRIIRTVLEKCRHLSEKPPAPAGSNRFKRMAEMLRRLDKPDRMEVLAALEQNDPDMVASVKEYLYSFDDLLVIEDRSMQKLLAEIDSKSLASASEGRLGSDQGQGPQQFVQAGPRDSERGNGTVRDDSAHHDPAGPEGRGRGDTTFGPGWRIDHASVTTRLWRPPHCRMQNAECRMQIADCLFHSAFCILQSAIVRVSH